jgi:cob(I)alamin adenosyltransferase
MGTVEEGSKAIGGVIESLKAQPLSLALVVMNLALLALFFYIAQKTSETRKREMDAVYAEQKEVREMLVRDNREVREMLTHCVLPTQRP